MPSLDFDSDPFAEMNKDPSKSKSRRRMQRSKSADSGMDCPDVEPAAPRQKTRPRRRASIAARDNAEEEPEKQELQLPGEEKPRRRRGGGGASVDGSVDSNGSGGDAPRPRRGRRMSISGGGAAAGGGGGGGDTDYGYGDAPPQRGVQRANSNELDYGYGAPTAAAPAGGAPRRRGRRMSVGGAAPAIPAQQEVDYGYGDSGAGAADSYDAKFGGAAKQEEEPEEAKPQRSRERRVKGVHDIKNADYTETSSRQLGGNPRGPTNSMVTPMTVPDVKKKGPRRRASLVGAVGAVAGAAVGSVKMGDDNGDGRRGKMLKNRRGSVRALQMEEEDVGGAPVKSADRFREGSMLERLG